MIRALCVAALLFGAVPALAHEKWANNVEVPAWAKASCCGPNDVHHLTAAQVHALPDGWHIDGIGTIVPYDKVLPSEDGDYWAFWPEWATKPTDKPPIYCFFAPAQSY